MQATTASIEQFFEANSRVLLGYAFNKTGDLHAAEDLVQETALQAIKRYESFNSSRGSLKTWIFIILDSLAIDWFRRENRHKTPRQEQLDEVSFTRNDVVLPIDVASETELDRLLAELSIEHREVVRLVVLEGWSSVEAAGLIGIPPATARSRLFYALGKLRAKMSEGGELL